MTGPSMLQADGGRGDQREVVRFLTDPTTYGGIPVLVVETHGAYVFLAGEQAIKIKRAIRYEYMDLSTLGLRKRMLRREFALNRATAPRIYREVVAITRRADGNLELGGTGTVVEWALRMWRFPAADELSVIAERGAFSDALADDLGSAIFAYHGKTPRREADGARLIGDILDELDAAFAGMHAELGAQAVAAFHAGSRAHLAAFAPRLNRRAAEGHVRRCHGDLHLRNLVLLDGVPTPFDALEFSETLGTCDVLYDLAFLIMDLRHRALPGAANIVLNSYLLAAAGAEDAGLAALPLFITVRAAIRAMVGVQAHRAFHNPRRLTEDDARQYLAEALAALAPAAPRLIAVGGVSGTGKSTLSRALAPQIGAAPGAVHLRSDLERKAMAGVAPRDHLSPGWYSRTSREQVYRRMFSRARRVLAAGHCVLLDATFLDRGARDAAASLARELAVPFTGLWLEAGRETLLGRVGARIDDASDADAAIVRQQLALDPGQNDWQRVNAEGPFAKVLARAATALGI
ncbi:AAA family ATPase [Phaeovulum sp.]|uniref:bifunctional aminoglycoside phosphotransferase/ATP-binding protein n=1 Tax=Phaeovulum sp. TaxID=2934796 RepID=UPI002730ACA7|nr:bifunctional aminoglycoside phosphotransferase/ATP-binding protein [Phaeovulum sp.]MDP1669610.1 AAA family ATPase [Phaeovulum sp.]